MSGKIIKAADINAILLTVRAINKDDGDWQLTALALALVVSCRSCGVDKAVALRHIRHLFNTEVLTAPLAEVVTQH